MTSHDQSQNAQDATHNSFEGTYHLPTQGNPGGNVYQAALGSYEDPLSQNSMGHNDSSNNSSNVLHDPSWSEALETQLSQLQALEYGSHANNENRFPVADGWVPLLPDTFISNPPHQNPPSIRHEAFPLNPHPVPVPSATLFDLDYAQDSIVHGDSNYLASLQAEMERESGPTFQNHAGNTMELPFPEQGQTMPVASSSSMARPQYPNAEASSSRISSASRSALRRMPRGPLQSHRIPDESLLGHLAPPISAISEFGDSRIHNVAAYHRVSRLSAQPSSVPNMNTQLPPVDPPHPLCIDGHHLPRTAPVTQVPLPSVPRLNIDPVTQPFIQEQQLYDSLLGLDTSTNTQAATNLNNSSDLAFNNSHTLENRGLGANTSTTSGRLTRTRKGKNRPGAEHRRTHSKNTGSETLAVAPVPPANDPQTSNSLGSPIAPSQTASSYLTPHSPHSILPATPDTGESSSPQTIISNRSLSAVATPYHTGTDSLPSTPNDNHVPPEMVYQSQFRVWVPSNQPGSASAQATNSVLPGNPSQPTLDADVDKITPEMAKELYPHARVYDGKLIPGFNRWRSAGPPRPQRTLKRTRNSQGQGPEGQSPPGKRPRKDRK